jgi:hypothetical protein
LRLQVLPEERLGAVPGELRRFLVVVGSLLAEEAVAGPLVDVDFGVLSGALQGLADLLDRR